ncbi:polysaccharide pyruvyl transferase family protein [Desulfosarcina sp.]|uniref:polysaccharide pyruvyl transferase family protein n=1 Tax=Desulfosarcina sp. TaxID=2027861 RepID=UPI0029A76B6D|nr:polysaccharide pyruvyl transferase family protein [Desulfosarcina sp.]MDX2455217.1 polysaccharide pyruvyl transferase family protein [Desulfosarcina sp.]
MDKVNIGLFTASLNSGNMGCNALTYCALRLFAEVAEKLDQQLSYTLFSKDAQESLSYYEHLKGLDIRVVEPIVLTREIVRETLRGNYKGRSAFKRAVADCDLFFEIAGGDSYSDIYGMFRPVFYDKCHSLVRRKGAPLVFLPQTIGPFKSAKAKSLAAKGLSYASHIFARDTLSYNEAAQFTAADKISQTIDMGFFMEYEPAEPKAGKPRIGINPSGLLWHGGYTGNNQFGLRDDYQTLLGQMIESIDRDQYDIVLVPHVLLGPGYNVEDDYKICRLLNRKYRFCEMAPFFYTPVEAKSFISGLDLLAGSRMHCCIAAYSSGVPVYPLAYSRKFKGLFKETLGYPHGAELVTDDVATILAGLQQAIENRDQIKSEMPARLEKIAVYKESLVESLSKILSESALG